MEILNKADKKSKLPPKVRPVIKNIVASANFSCHFDLLKIASQVRKAKFQTRFFPATVIHIDEPKCTAIIFEQGKIDIVGTKSSDEAYIAARRVGKILNKLDYNIRIQNFQVVNIIAESNCNFEVELESIASNPIYKQFVNYNPRKSPGLVFKIPEIQITLLIFPFGKIVFNGAKNLNELEQAFKFIWPILKEYEVPDYTSKYYKLYPSHPHLLDEQPSYPPYIQPSCQPYELPVQTSYEQPLYPPYPQPSYPPAQQPSYEQPPYPPAQPPYQPYPQQSYQPYEQPPYQPYGQTYSPYLQYPQTAQQYEPWWSHVQQPYQPYAQPVQFGYYDDRSSYPPYHDWYPDNFIKKVGRRKSHHGHHHHHRNHW